jgi:hypothetical protein
MADNTLQTGSANIAADDVTTLNGAGSSGVLVQRVKPGFGVDGDFTDASSSNPFPVSLRSLNYPSSTNNSTSAQLAAGATFTGTIETIVSQQDAQIEVVCDQPYILTLYQYLDAGGTQLAWSQAFSVAANVPWMQNVTLPGNYFKLTLQNVGTRTTTTLAVDTTFGIMDTLPNTLTAAGNLRTSINEVGTSTGTLPVTISGDTSANATALDEIRNSLIGTSNNNAPAQGRSLTDILDPLGNQQYQIPVAPFGLELAGEQPSRQSIPVALSQEQANDAFYTVDGRALPIGYNALTGTLAGLETSKYSYIYFSQIGNASAGSFVCEASNDGAIWAPAQVSDSGPGLSILSNSNYTAGAIGFSTLAGFHYYVIPCVGRFHRIRVVATALSSTNVVFHIRLSRNPIPGIYFPQYVQGLGPEGNAASGSPVRIAGTDSGGAVRSPKLTTAGAVMVTPDNTSTGFSQITINSAATTNATSVKGSAGTVYNLVTSNTGAAAAFVKLYNKASAPTVGTDVPIVTISVPASGTVTILDAMVGYRFSTGIALAITNLAADSDATAVAAAQVKVIGMYI